MIHFNLKCSCSHKFDAWFKNGDDFESQKAKKLLSCPLCGSSLIEKAPMSPNLGKKSFKTENSLANVVSKIKENIKSNCEYVGDKFAEEARKIHYGEAEKKGIYGEASLKETKELKEEGIDVISLPFPIKTNA